jgi:predicted NAD-dependent protein-ADP-ribosyltransferase YbiA (DUF1768 family)
MKVRMKDGLLIVIADTPDERHDLAEWAGPVDGHVFALLRQPDGQTIRLTDLGPREQACREPINVTSRSPEPIVLISNFAQTPFDLDGQRYASVEGFWQSLKFPDPMKRHEVAALHGGEARAARFSAPDTDTFEYCGRTVRVGTADHWDLMRAACEAKFAENAAARAALLTTGSRPLTHRTRRDSRTIPGVVMSDIWMTIRGRISQEAEVPRVV